MYAALNAWTFPHDTTPADQVRQAAAAGFQGLELAISDDGPLTSDTPATVFNQLASQAADQSLTIVGLATGQYWQTNFACPDPADRQRAVDFTLRLLDRAAAARAGSVLIVPAVVGKAGEPRMRIAYADALERTVSALATLRFEAEARGVVLAIENVWNRFLLSPLEAASMIDRINSPCVAFYLDVGNILPTGYPQDWIATLAGRIARVHAKDYRLATPGSAGFCALGEGDVDWPGVVHALRQVGYDGPLTYEGPGDLATVHRRLTNILTDRPVLTEEAAK